MSSKLWRKISSNLEFYTQTTNQLEEWHHYFLLFSCGAIFSEYRYGIPISPIIGWRWERWGRGSVCVLGLPRAQMCCWWYSYTKPFHSSESVNLEGLTITVFEKWGSDWREMGQEASIFLYKQKSFLTLTTTHTHLHCFDKKENGI